MEPECDNCWAVNKKSSVAVTLGNGMKLCADCWAELKDDCELIEPEESQ